VCHTVANTVTIHSRVGQPLVTRMDSASGTAVLRQKALDLGVGVMEPLACKWEVSDETAALSLVQTKPDAAVTSSWLRRLTTALHMQVCMQIARLVQCSGVCVCVLCLVEEDQRTPEDKPRQVSSV
jgi:hypothetical protein